VLTAQANAADFHVDPEAGRPDGDGSQEKPWRTLEEVIGAGLVETRDWAEHPAADGGTLVAKNAGAPVGAGDTIWLASGHHGALIVAGAYNEAPITIAAMEGATPTLTRVLLRSASNWVLRGVSVSPAHGAPYEERTIVDVDDHAWGGPSHDIVVAGCTVFSVEDSSGWLAQDWVARAKTGIGSDSDGVTVRDNTIENVSFGISMGGDRALVSGNSIRNFSGDGLRGNGDDSVFEGNYVANCYAVDDNHDDGFQSWSVGPDGVGTGEVRRMVLRGNVIVNNEDPDQPLQGPLQGIGCFDGFYVDWIVENNVVVVDHWHGITLLGARGGRIVNNTVIDARVGEPGPPWVRFGDHKDGRPSLENVVRNNLTTAVTNSTEGVVVSDNLVIDDPTALFVDGTFPYDLHLAAGSAAIDVGHPDAPAVDVEGVARPQGDGIDIGAYEFVPPSPAVDARAPASDAGPVDAATDAAVSGPPDAAQVAAKDAAAGGDCRAVGGGASRGLAVLLVLGAAQRRRGRSR